MMKKILTICSLALLIISCSKEKADPCEDIICYNGGVCVDGSCDCPPPFTGPQCENDTTTVDPCEGIVCINGDCENGVCDCDQGWTGPRCDKQDTPSSVTITRIEVLRFPATDNGAGWDLTSGPELYLIVANYNSGQVLYNSGYFENANPNNTYEFDLEPDLTLYNLKEDFLISAYDYDSSSDDDYMGGIYNKVYFNTNNFPSSVTWDAGGPVSFKLYLTYSW